MQTNSLLQQLSPLVKLEEAMLNVEVGASEKSQSKLQLWKVIPVEFLRLKLENSDIWVQMKLY